jgi:DNA-binding cell septation regulator SpoVG
MEVRVVKFSRPPLTRPRSVLALAQITVFFEKHSVTVDDLRVVQNRQGELWLAMPTMKDAQGSYQAIVEFSMELRQQITSKILPAYREWALRAQSAQTQSSRGAQ